MRAKLMAAASLIACVSGPVGAETLREALAKAYSSNPTITGARAQQRATDENVPIARAAGLPSVNTSLDFNQNLLRGGNSIANPARRLNGFAGVTVPVYSGGAVRNSVRAAEIRVEGGEATLRNTEATTFTDVVAAYNDVIRDEAIVGLNRQNVKVLETNLRASRDRFEVGDLTRTDVAQSEARLSLARAQLQSVEASLIGSRENYVRLVGSAPGMLQPPPPLPNLGVTSDSAVEVALTDNPALLAAQKQRDATGYDVRAARAARLPQLGVTVGQNYNNFFGSLGAGQGFSTEQSGTSTVAGVNVSLPIFQGGRVGAQIRQAQARRGVAMENVTATERQVIANTRAAYAIWKSSMEVIKSAEVAVSANRLSLEGVRAENSVGNRTILEILNAEQELLNSQVTLVTARRDSYVAGFALLAAMGKAEAEDLGLEGGPLYDPSLNFKRVRGKISDFSSDADPQPVATSTRGTAGQDAVVTGKLDPILDTPVDRELGNPSGTRR